MDVKGTKFDDRAAASAKAKQELLARARAKSPAQDPEFAARMAARAAANKEREERLARRKIEKAEAARIAEETRLAEEARLKLEAEEKARQEEADRLRREAAQIVAEAKQKLAADARFATRAAPVKRK